MHRDHLPNLAGLANVAISLRTHDVRTSAADGTEIAISAGAVSLAHVDGAPSPRNIAEMHIPSDLARSRRELGFHLRRYQADAQLVRLARVPPFLPRLV